MAFRDKLIRALLTCIACQPSKYWLMGFIIIVGGCDSGSSQPVVPLILPDTIERAVQDDLISIRITVNGTVAVSSRVLDAGITGIEIDRSYFDDQTNSIEINFYMRDRVSTLHRVAESSSTFVLDQGNLTHAINMSSYQYEDSDGDGRVDIEELMSSPNDPDGDSLANYLDNDSDGDNILDGEDWLPYGDQSMPVISSLAIRLPDGSQQELIVRSVNVGGHNYLSQLAERSEALPITLPSSWPWRELPRVIENWHWEALVLHEDNGAPCPEWSGASYLDTSSLISKSSHSYMLWFDRHDQDGRLVPVRTGEISSLDIFSPDQGLPSMRPLNDGLRMVLVPDSAVGSLSMWPDENYGGSVCSINLREPK